MDDRLNRMEDKLEEKSKQFNELSTEVLVTLEKIKTTLENLEEYAHNKIHVLMNDSKGMSFQIEDLRKQMELMEKDVSNLKMTNNKWSNFSMRLLYGFIMLIAGGIGGAIFDRFIK